MARRSKAIHRRPARGAGRLADRARNPYFTRSIANRVWANFFGRGIVEPVDDLRVSNPASNEPLLEAISAHLVENRYDLKALMRLILQSETYQRTSAPLPENMGDQKYYSRYYPRRLMAEVLQDAITSVTRISPSTTKSRSPTAARRERTFTATERVHCSCLTPP